MNIFSFDRKLIAVLKYHNDSIARVGLFVIFFWFGLLKVLGLSPATPLVRTLYERLFCTPAGFDNFLIFFGIFEVIIGLLFLIKGWERVVLPLLALHMITTVLPLIFLPSLAWTGIFIPTLEGQYIIKNLALIAAAVSVGAHLHELKKVWASLKKKLLLN